MDIGEDFYSALQLGCHQLVKAVPFTFWAIRLSTLCWKAYRPIRKYKNLHCSFVIIYHALQKTYFYDCKVIFLKQEKILN